MKQIKTIMEQNPDRFDERVNKALTDGWYIVRRLANHGGFIAEMEKVVITEKERSCDNCMFRPIGFDWKVTTACIGALAAKEIFVSQLGILYAEGETDEESVPLRRHLIRNYTPLQGFCIMLFCLLSIPCLATLAITRRELNSWKMTICEGAGLFCLAYVTAFIVYQAGLLLKIGTNFLV